MPDLVRLLQRSPVSYGKGAIVGVNGEFEHGGACIHPMLGKRDGSIEGCTSEFITVLASPFAACAVAAPGGHYSARGDLS